MEKREGSAAQIDQNPEELAGSIQGCKLAVARSGGGEPHSKTASTSKLNLGLGNDYNFLKLPDGAELRFGRGLDNAMLQEAPRSLSDLVAVPAADAHV